MKAYSNDLRQKIVETNKQELESIGQTADRFHVSYSFVWELFERYRETGKVNPKAHGGGAKSKLNQQQWAVVAQDNDATLEELLRELQARTEVKVSRATMGGIVQKLRLTRKKLCTRRTERLNGYSNGESNIGKKLEQ